MNTRSRYDSSDNEEVMRHTSRSQPQSYMSPNTAAAASASAASMSTPSPTSSSSSRHRSNRHNNNNNNNSSHLPAMGIHASPLTPDKETRNEADYYKGIGNRHMAAQEYEKAYEAYSQSLSISPLGPRSHIYLSNRAAALLSLKRYDAASIDARRAISLAPTFGKAHARLGQSLYFLKEYAGAVAAYENAFQFEPENQVTWTYLRKAKQKFARQHDKMRRKEEERLDSLENAMSNMSVGETVGPSVGSVEEDTETELAAGVLNEEDDVGGHDVNVRRQRRQPFVGERLMKAVEPGYISSPKNKKPSSQQETMYYENANDATSIQKFNQDDDEDSEDDYDDEDPDFDEALKLQERATLKLVHKQYRSAVEEFSAALFLVPDDDNLTPHLYVGRAHALNGLQRHDGAMNDAMMSLGRNPDFADAHVVLARSYYYVQDYEECVTCFENAKDCIKRSGMGGTLSPLDDLYLEKALEAVEEGQGGAYGGGEIDDGRSTCFSIVKDSGKGPIPKIKPPRFVSRATLLKSAPEPPPIPKQWSNQLPATPIPLRVGPERKITFVSEAMGVKLNRGSDGIVRVVSVQETSRSIVRDGDVYAGDIIREAAGVDLRRPLTKVMWSDTVAFLKLSDRPLTLLVAKELSDVPSAVVEELNRAMKENSSSLPKQRRQRRQSTQQETEEEKYEIGKEPHQYYSPSPASGIEPIADTKAMLHDSIEIMDDSAAQGVEESLIIPIVHASSIEQDDSLTEGINQTENIEHNDSPTESINHTENIEQDGLDDSIDCNEEATPSAHSCESIEGESELQERKSNSDRMDMNNVVTGSTLERITSMQSSESSSPGVCNFPEAVTAQEKNSDKGDEETTKIDELPAFNPSITEYKSLADNGSDISSESESETSLSFEEIAAVEKTVSAPSLRKDIIFLPKDENAITSPNQGWTNESWLACKQTRKLHMCCEVARKVKGRFLFWSNDEQVVRTLAVFTDPDIILICREPTNMAEVQSSLTDIPPKIFESMTTDSFAVAETVIDLKTCKMRLSPLTTPSSVCENTEEESEKNSKEGSCGSGQMSSYFDLITPLETIALSVVFQAKSESNASENALQKTFRCELALKNALLNAHGLASGNDADASWQHQIILGSLYSHVISGNYGYLERALAIVPYSIINGTDNSGFTALHHACIRRSNKAVKMLLTAGADASIPSLKSGKTPCHLSAEKLDGESLDLILSVPSPTRPDPNAQDCKGQTPMYTAAIHGRFPSDASNPALLSKCLTVLESWGGQLFVDNMYMKDNKSNFPELQHPIDHAVRHRLHGELAVLLKFCFHRFPIAHQAMGGYGPSIAAIFHYPLHSCLLSLKLEVLEAANIEVVKRPSFDSESFLSTMETLLKIGVEPNERIEHVSVANPISQELRKSVGFSPLQILLTLCCYISKEKELLSNSKNAEWFDNIISTLPKAAELLVEYGARVWLDKPLMTRPDRSTETKGEGKLSSLVKDSSSQSIDLSEINLEKNKGLIGLIGGADRLAKARSKWLQTQIVKGYGQALLQGKGLNITIEDCNEAGGSSSATCSICWKIFGVIRNRKHVCRSSRRYVCEDCSSKVVMQDGDARRVSDGQFNLAFNEARDREDRDKESRIEQAERRKNRIAQAQAARMKSTRRPLVMEKEEKLHEAKNELFANVGKAVQNFFMEEVPTADDRNLNGQDQLNGMASSLNQTRDALNERGEKLSTLAEKTGALRDASRDFAKMAKELKQSQQKGLFW